MKRKQTKWLSAVLFFAGAVLVGFLFRLLWEYVPRASARYGILAVCGGIVLLNLLWSVLKRRQIEQFSDDICETLDAAYCGTTAGVFSAL